jgi:hypothetical protein
MRSNVLTSHPKSSCGQPWFADLIAWFLESRQYEVWLNVKSHLFFAFSVFFFNRYGAMSPICCRWVLLEQLILQCDSPSLWDALNASDTTSVCWISGVVCTYIIMFVVCRHRTRSRRGQLEDNDEMGSGLTAFVTSQGCWRERLKSNGDNSTHYQYLCLFGCLHFHLVYFFFVFLEKR